MISNALDILGLLNPKGSGQAVSVTTDRGEDGLFEQALQESQIAQDAESVPASALEVVDDMGLPPSIAGELAAAMPGHIATLDRNLAFDIDTGNGSEMLRIVLMSILAVGTLAQRVDQDAKTVSPVSPNVEHAAHMAAAAVSFNASGSRSDGPRIWLGQTGSSSIAVASQMSRGADAYLSKSTSGSSAYERVLAAVLPSRENLLIVTASDEKRVFIRNFFSPETALDSLRGLDRGRPGPLSNAHVYVNGNYKGRI